MATKPRSNAIYMLPAATGENEIETQRLTTQHKTLSKARGQLQSSTTGRIDAAKHALDLGCGTGIWAGEFALTHPWAQVYGVDLMRPSFTSPLLTNLQFFSGNVESAETWQTLKVPSAGLDYIHARLLIAGIYSWPSLFHKVATHLAPGGLFEHYEGSLRMLASTASSNAETYSPAIEYFNQLAQSISVLGLDPTAPDRSGQMLEEAGLRVVEHKIVETNLDPARNVQDDQEDREAIAASQLENWACLIAVMTDKVAGFMTKPDAANFQKLAKDAQKDMIDNGRTRGYFARFHVYIAEKPGT